MKTRKERIERREEHVSEKEKLPEYKKIKNKTKCHVGGVYWGLGKKGVYE